MSEKQQGTEPQRKNVHFIAVKLAQVRRVLRDGLGVHEPRRPPKDGHLVQRLASGATNGGHPPDDDTRTRKYATNTLTIRHGSYQHTP